MRGHSRSGRSRDRSRAWCGGCSANSDESTCFMAPLPSGMDLGELQIVVAGDLDRHDFLIAADDLDGRVLAVVELLETKAYGPVVMTVLVQVDLLEQVSDLFRGL